jgi:hypothetical protein
MPESSSKELTDSSATVRAFSYRPLKTGEIRFITINAAETTDRNELIRCSLHHYSLTSPPPSNAVPRYEWGDYVALSYSWGWDAQSPSRQIDIDGHLCNITESLDAALRTLRTSQTTTTIHVRFWVDALCINQSDREEVKSEILRMRDIYSQAFKVYAHLGTESEDSELGFKLIYRTFKELSQSAENTYRALVNKRLSPSDLERRAYLAMLRLLNRPYWHRVWVLQELAMSRGSLTVGCGTIEMYLEEILPVSRFVCLNAENIIILLGGIADAELPLLFGMHLMHQMYTLTWATRTQKVHNLQQTTLKPRAKYNDIHHPLLILAQSAQATRSHDNVYGLLSIMPESIREKMSPYVDYDLPVAVVFTAFSKTIIEYTEHLDIIFAKSFGQTMTPSWATDWSMAIDRATLPHDWELFCYDQFDGAYDDLRKVIESSSLYRADGGRKPQFTFIPNGSTDNLLLKCCGICIGAVDGLGFALRSDNIATERTECVQPRSTLNPYGDDEAVTRALIHTLFCNPTWGDTVGASLFHIPWTAHQEDPAAYFSSDETINVTNEDIELITQLRTRGWDMALGNNFLTFEWWRRSLSQFRIGGKRFQDYFDTDIVDCVYPAQRVRVDIATAVGAYASRCLVTLDSGHFGLAPYTTQRDDKVVVLQGCSIPVVLRPVGETGQFTVVGECYVDGYGNGEAWDAVRRGDFVIEDVVLS